MCPFDLPLHHEKNHLNKQGWCKFIALIWIVLLCFSCSLQNPEDLFRITQTLNMSDSHPKAFCHIFHSASRALSTVSPWQYKYECNLLAGHLALQRDHQLYNQSNNVYVFLMQFGGFCLYLIWKPGGEWCTLKVPSIKPGTLWWPGMHLYQSTTPQICLTLSLNLKFTVHCVRTSWLPCPPFASFSFGFYFRL